MKTKTNKYLFLSLVLMLTISSFSQENLNNYLEIAANNNPALKAKFNDYMAAMEKVPQVGALPDPTVAFGYFIQSPETRVGPQRATFNLAQSFPWFGLLSAQEDVATEMAKAKYEDFENTKSNIFFEVKTAYYNYYFIEKAIEITKENIEILEVFKRLSLVKIEAGTASIVDELRVELELNDLENQLALFLDTKDALQVNFNNLLDIDDTSEIVIPEVLWQEDIPLDQLKMLDEIYASNHQIKSIEHKLNAFVNQEVVAKKQGLPKFNIGLGYTVVGENAGSSVAENGKDAFMFPSVGVTIPLYRKKYKALIKEAQYLQEAEISRKVDKKNTLSSVYENINKDFNDGDRRIALNKRQSEIAKKVLDILITSYSTNAKDFEEVLRIERQMLKYELEYQKALTDKNAAVAFMDYLIGK
ncbi:TolC family protein [Maribacter polysaccharolyticus]|uniref:TolC family protein n=1 Tax=Maribacter polysaccharolyticus TaxID=3020831 RepID=UPI00237EFF0D|nr:TolC family protein [Maribacter polysaccharolyticus]MDE3741075.1 TolC family protein [Maribacter polysaccharolyticus]